LRLTRKVTKTPTSSVGFAPVVGRNINGGRLIQPWGHCRWGSTLSSKHLPAHKHSYAKRLIALGLTITIGFSAIFVMVLWESRARDREQGRQAAANVIATISSDIERNLELYDLSLQAVVDGLKRSDLSQISPELRQLVLFDRAATAKDMGSIFVLDKDGDVTVDSRTLTPHPENYSKNDFFIAQERNPNDGLYVSRPWVDSNGEYFIAISRRLTDTGGLFSGAVVGTLRLNYFRNLFGKLKLNDRDALTLVRSDGTVLMRTPFSSATIGRNLAASPIFQKIATYPRGSFEGVAGIDGFARIYVYQGIGEYPLIISYGLSLDAIYAAWLQKVWRIGLIMLALCATNVALIVFLANALKRRSEAERLLAVSATTDGLTGLCNRRRFDEMLDIEWRRAMRSQNPVALLMVDVDNFKAYNDQFGHQAGDAALAAIANCIQDNTQRAADISARYGGEEFAILLPETSLSGAAEIAERIRASVLSLRLNQQGRPDSTPTVSVGAASLVPRQGLQPRDIIKAADTALYQAKGNGRNRTELWQAPSPDFATPERLTEAA
jgi:diguanylate cyclase (GGDEF)-like protein